MLRLTHIGDRHLMRAPKAFGLEAIDLFGAGPTFRRLQNDHRPGRTGAAFALTRSALDRADLVADSIDRTGHELMHLCRVVPLHPIRLVTVAAKEAGQLILADAREY